MNIRFEIDVVLLAQSFASSLQAQPFPSPHLTVIRLEGPSTSMLPRPAEVSGAPSAWTVASRDADAQVWVSEVTYRDHDTGRLSSRQAQVVELGTGLNYRDGQGQWQPTREEFELTPDGFAVARHGPHHVILANNINAEVVVDLLTPDQQRLRSRVVGIGYYDPVSGQSVFLAEMQGAPGALVAPNEVLYRQAFKGLEAPSARRWSSRISPIPR